MLFEGDYLRHVDAILTALKKVRREKISAKQIQVIGWANQLVFAVLTRLM
jgi:hypothetical protein